MWGNTATNREVKRFILRKYLEANVMQTQMLQHSKSFGVGEELSDRWTPNIDRTTQMLYIDIGWSESVQILIPVEMENTASVEQLTKAFHRDLVMKLSIFSSPNIVLFMTFSPFTMSLTFTISSICQTFRCSTRFRLRISQSYYCFKYVFILSFTVWI